MRFSGQTPLVGLDIGSSSIKAVALRRKGEGVEVERAGILPLPAGVFSNGVYLDPPAVSDCIRKVWHEHSISGKRVAVALSGEDVCHLRLRLERSDAGEIQARVREQAAALIPFPLGQTKLDFQVQDQFPQSKWTDVLVAAAAEVEVSRQLGLVERAGMSAAVVDTAACALANAFEHNYHPAASDITAILQVGNSLMTVVILRGAALVLARDLPLAPGKFAPALKPAAERIIAELERVWEHLDEIAEQRPLEPSSRQVQRLVLSGGGARLRGLDDALRQRFKLPVEEMNPFLKIDYRSSDALSRLAADHAHCMAVAVGLALRGLEEP